MKKYALLFFTLLLFAFSPKAELSKTINLSSAGTLGTALSSEEISNVTSLKITGSIDQRDFVTMKNMSTNKLLRSIDLSEASIIEYVDNGTTYPANTIPTSAFNTTQINSILFPTNLKTIGFQAFWQCVGLSSVTIPNGVETLESCAFGGCYNMTSVSIPNSVTTMGTQAFYYCSSLSSITLPNNLTSLTQDVFAENGITSIFIPKSVVNINPRAFFRCTKLTSITLEEGNTAYSTNDGVLFTIDGKTLVYYPTGKNSTSAYSMPEGTETISMYSFCYCNLSSLTIPSSVNVIVDFAFSYSTVNSITVKKSTPPTSYDAFMYLANSRANCALIVPYGAATNYSKADDWKEFTNITEETATNILTDRNNSKILFYPNPATDKITISVNSESSVILTNQLGQVVLTDKVSETKTIDVSSFPGGLYILKIGNYQQKIVLK